MEVERVNEVLEKYQEKKDKMSPKKVSEDSGIGTQISHPPSTDLESNPSILTENAIVFNKVNLTYDQEDAQLDGETNIKKEN